MHPRVIIRSERTEYDTPASSLTVLLGRLTIGIFLWILASLALLGLLTVLYLSTLAASVESSLKLSTPAAIPDAEALPRYQEEEISPPTGYPVAPLYSE